MFIVNLGEDAPHRDFYYICTAEEFAHIIIADAYREIGLSYIANWPGHFELEGKMMAVYYMSQQSGYTAPDYSWRAINDFMNDPTERNFNKAYNGMCNSQNYPELNGQGDYNSFRTYGLDKLRY